VSGIWSHQGGRWRPLERALFPYEKDLHDLIEHAPELLPLAGQPRLAVLGREVRCGPGSADLVAVEVDTGRPVVIEIKLATNADRRQVLTQVLGYAAAIRRLDSAGFDALLASQLAGTGATSVAEAVASGSQEGSVDADVLRQAITGCLAEGRLRCVIVIDRATPDVIELVGYLQEVTNDRLTLDLVTVAAYEVGQERVIVPQLVEPARASADPPSTVTATTNVLAKSAPVKGSTIFAASIEQAPPEKRDALHRLLLWAQNLESDGLAVLYSSTGKGRWVLNPRLPGQERGMVVVWNEGGGSLSPFRTVLQQQAPRTLARLDEVHPGEIGQGNYIKAAYDDALLALLHSAYEEAARG